MKKVLIIAAIMSFLLLIPSTFADRTDTIVSMFAINSTGHFNMVGDFSNGVNFSVQPPSNETWVISRTLVHFEDEKNWDATKYGKDLTLTNGVIVQLVKNGTILDLTDGHPIRKTAEWGALCYDVTLYDGFTGTDFANVRWTFSKSGTFIKLEGDKNDEIRVVLRDDYSGLIDHHLLFQGYKLETQGDNMYQAIAIGLTLFAILFIGIGVYIFKRREHE